MSCVIPNKTEKVKTALRNNKLDYEEMRQRLLETERKLQSLNKLEAEFQSVTEQTFSDQGMRGRDYLIEESEREDLESVPSAISTLPGSYTGFAVNQMPSSTPSRANEANKSQNNKAVMYSPLDSDSSMSSTISRSRYDMKLLKQNQRLLTEVERLVGDIHMSNQKNADLMKDAEKAKTVNELEDRIDGLVSENKAQDKALREAERHLDEGQRRNTELQKRLSMTEAELSDVRMELSELKLVKKEIGTQRDEALLNFNEAQDSLQDYQRKAKEKIKKMEEKEDELQESLTSTSQERDDLLDQLSSMEMSIASQEAQIHRLLNDVNSEDARAQEFEASNQQLKTQLDLLTAQISEYETDLEDAEAVKKEKMFLESEVKGFRTMAQGMKALVKLLHKTHSISSLGDDSGHFSVKSWPVECGEGDGQFEGGLLAAELNCNNNGLTGCEASSCEGGPSNMVCEMRNLVTNMDCEILRLRSDLKQRDADDRTYSNLRDELKVLMDKVECGISQNQDLECQVANLEVDKKNMATKLEETLNCTEEQVRTMQCLETRLNERSVQIVCLQEDVDERNVRINTLEGQICDLQKRLKGCDKNVMDSEPLIEAYARIKELEAVLLCKNKSFDDLQDKLCRAMKDLRSNKMDTDNQIECLNFQLSESHQEIDRLKEEGEALRQRITACQKMSDELKRMSRVKDEKIGCLSDEVEELKYEKDKIETFLTKQLEDCGKELTSSQDQCKDLENALAMCRNEVCDHLNMMDEIRTSFQNELEQRDACIRKLKEDLRQTVEELKCKMEDNNSLEHSVAELKNKLQQMCCQLNQADSNIQCLNIKIQEIEKLMLKEKSAWMKESEELERRLVQACNNLSVANTEINQLKQMLQEKKVQNDTLQGEKSHMCQELKKYKDYICNLEEKLKKMEADNQELCRQLQQKMECIRDLENMIRTKEQELKCLTKFIQDLQDNKDEAERLKELEIEVKTLKEQLNRCREENKCKSTMLCECEEAFKRCQLLSQDKDEEIQLLKCKIETLNNKLSERISRVEELERGIENLHKDVERRMIRVDEQLKKYETELVDRLQEIAELKEEVNTCQLNLTEKMTEIQQQEQKICLLAGELHSLKLKLKEAEDSRDHLNSQLVEKKSEVAELTQELRLNREQMQKQHEDLVQSRQALSCAQRDRDKLRRELDDAIASLEHRDCEISRLNEERKNLMDKVAQLTCRLEQETCMLQQQLSEAKCRMEKEMECLRNYSCQLETTNNHLNQKLSMSQRQMMQMEKCFHQKLDSLTRDVEDFSAKLALRDDELMSCKDCIALKDSEIGRLKRRLCNCEKACIKECNSNCNNCYDDGVNANGLGDGEDEQDTVGDHNKVVKSKTKTDLSGDWNDNGGTNTSQNKGDNSLEEDDRLSSEDIDQSSHPRLSSESECSTRNSLGVTEVQERLRTNHLRQKEIERQLQSLEEVTQESIGDQKEEEEEEG